MGQKRESAAFFFARMLTTSENSRKSTVYEKGVFIHSHRCRFCEFCNGTADGTGNGLGGTKRGNPIRHQRDGRGGFRKRGMAPRERRGKALSCRGGRRRRMERPSLLLQQVHMQRALGAGRTGHLGPFLGEKMRVGQGLVLDEFRPPSVSGKLLLHDFPRLEPQQARVARADDARRFVVGISVREERAVLQRHGLHVARGVLRRRDALPALARSGRNPRPFWNRD